MIRICANIKPFTKCCYKPCNRHVSIRRIWSSRAATVSSKPVLISSDLVYGNNYDIHKKEKNNIIDIPALSTITHGVWISGGWLLQKNISYNRLVLAIQNSINVFPWFSARITNIDKYEWTLNCNNQGIKLNVICHPSLSINNEGENKIKYDNLQTALKPYNRDIFFTSDKPHGIDQGNMKCTPIVNIQLNYLNKQHIDTESSDDIDGDDGCVITFKLCHGFGDEYTGYMFMEYLSDFLCNNDLTKYENIEYKQIISLSNDEFIELKNKYKDPMNFEKKYNFHDKPDGTEIFPYISFYRQTKLDMFLTNIFQKFFPYLVSMKMDCFELKFNQNDIEKIRNIIMDEINDENITLSTYEVMISYLSLLIAKYESSSKLLKRLLVPISLRNRCNNFDNNTFGNVSLLFAVGIDDNMEYNAGNFALKVNDCLNIYARKTKKNTIFRNDDFSDSIQGMMDDFYVMGLMYEWKYNFSGRMSDIIKNEIVIWDEFRSLKLYENYTFGTNTIPIYYLYGTHFTGNKYILLESPNDDSVIVFMRMPKSKAAKFRQNETEFFSKHEITQNF